MGSYRPLAGLAGGFLLAIAIVAAVSLSHAVQPPVTPVTAPSSGNQRLIAPNNSAGMSATRPGSNASTTSQATLGMSNIQAIAKQGVPSILVTLTPLLVGITLGVGAHQLWARRVEREE